MRKDTGISKQAQKDEKELAYLYDLIITPQWRETFDRILDEELKLPEEGKFLDAECGTGGYAIDLAVRGGSKVLVLGVDPSEERLTLAREKAKVKKLDQISFERGSLLSLPVADGSYDFVVGDATLLSRSDIAPALAELRRVAAPDAPMALKLTTRGGFDEFYSIYWEALYNLDLLEYSPQLEAMITEPLTVSDTEDLALAAHWREMRSVTQKEHFIFPEGKLFFESPLIQSYFLDRWFAILPDDGSRDRVQQAIAKLIDEAGSSLEFDASVKATVILGKR